MSDPEGDSEMQPSSPSVHEEDSDAMFPTESASPLAAHVMSEGGYGDLSPPHSQDLAPFDRGENQDTSRAHGDGIDAEGEGQDLQLDSASNGENSTVPGASWNNPKAREEVQRAWANVVDKNFSLKRFGDPFDESKHPDEGQP